MARRFTELSQVNKYRAVVCYLRNHLYDLEKCILKITKNVFTSTDVMSFFVDIRK